MKKSERSTSPKGGGLADALFAATQLKVLQLIFLHPDRSFFASELIALAASGSGAVQREIARLVESGLVSQTVVGRQRHYQANADSPIFDELRGIIVKIAGIPDRLSAALRPLTNRIAFAILYGSIAKGTSKSGSDIDVLIVGDGIKLEELHSAFESTERTLRRKIHPTLYSLEEFKRRQKSKNPFLMKVLGGDTVLLSGNPNAVQAAIQPRKNRNTEV
ncbi:MAG TPA: nucleotidyltransferase domain-containing protein [Steroidobacteraceae bacterium]|nr:nucleotidyltransferase domain-containing protein [Steroidobacteraceae bacterium]